jgi:putative membrane protein
MLLQWLFGTFDLLGLPLGLAAVWARSCSLWRPRNVTDLSPVFVADNVWGATAVLWIATGLFRVFGGFEKGAVYYLHDRAFYIKMALLVIILLLEVWSMTTLIRWHIQVRRGTSVNTDIAPTLARISATQAGLVVMMACAATAVARRFFC